VKLGINAKRKRMMKLIHKTIKKFGSVLSLALCCCLFVGCTQEPPDKEENIVTIGDKNKEAVQAVLESEFTVPNEEYVLITKKIGKKMDEIRQSNPEVGFIPEDSPEWLAYEDLVKKTFGPYFMDYAYDSLIPKAIAFSYHYGYLGVDENVRYEMKVSNIQVTQSKNKSSPKNYNFTAQVEYKSNSGEFTTHEIKGAAILSEIGKIGKFQINDDSGLGDKVSVDLQ
jgi:hypothetical protein